MIEQKHWRLAGAVGLAVSGLMTVYVTQAEWLRARPLLFLLFVAIAFTALLFAVWMALIDFRYIRLQYALAKKAIFDQTLGEQVLREEMTKRNTDNTTPPSPNRLN